MTAPGLFFDLAVRSALLLAAAELSARLFAAKSASRRHGIRLAALLALLALPALRSWTPRWTVAAPPLPAAAVRTVVTVAAASSRGYAKEGAWWLPVVWLLGAGALMVRVVRAQRAAADLVRRASAGPEGTRLSAEIDVPVVCGLWSPAIVLPPESVNWPRERWRAAVAHERMHVARRDTLARLGSQAVCALYWFQPLVWLIESARQDDCEQACDDGVLANGTKPSEYAGHLMEIARGLQGRARERGIAMTRTNQLQGRIAALLATSPDRRAAGMGFAAGLGALALAAVVAVSSLSLPLLAQAGRLSGIVRDDSGAPVPRARVDVKSAAGGAQNAAVHEVAYTNDSGEFAFDTMPDGAYTITVAKPGFARLEHQGVAFESAKARRMDMNLSLGIVQERVQVQGDRPAAPPAPIEEPKRLTVGGNVRPPAVEYKTRPVYPATAKADGVEGTVLLKAVISREGAILSLTAVNKLVDQRLVDSAMDAVKQWRYKPTLLNGNPVEVVTEVEVNFTLTR